VKFAVVKSTTYVSPSRRIRSIVASLPPPTTAVATVVDAELEVFGVLAAGLLDVGVAPLVSVDVETRATASELSSPSELSARAAAAAAATRTMAPLRARSRCRILWGRIVARDAAPVVTTATSADVG
jgi:hypothetical protein